MKGQNWRTSKQARLYIIGGLLVVVALIAFFFEGLRWWMLGVGVVLLGAFGMEMANTDIDLGTLVETGSISDSQIERDADNNLATDDEGGFMTSIWRDINGNAVPEGTAGAKGEDQFNCSDFATQSEAQVFFDNAGGVANDVNGLDGNSDGVPCQSLPAGA